MIPPPNCGNPAVYIIALILELSQLETLTVSCLPECYNASANLSVRKCSLIFPYAAPTPMSVLQEPHPQPEEVGYSKEGNIATEGNVYAFITQVDIL